MKWLGDYVKADMPIKDFCHALTMSGSKVECYEKEGSNISGVVVGKILSKGPHENADALFVHAEKLFHNCLPCSVWIIAYRPL
jgi:phenylalanyl-tRNA synthetase beta chain